MDISLKLADSYFGMLKSLSNETKLHLIKMLSDSMLSNEEKKVVVSHKKLEDYFGIWSDDAVADNMIKTIRENRLSGETRHIVSLEIGLTVR